MTKEQIRNKIIRLEEKLNSLESFYSPEIQNKNLSSDTKNLILQDYLDQKYETEKELKELRDLLLVTSDSSIPISAGLLIGLILFYFIKFKKK